MLIAILDNINNQYLVDLVFPCLILQNSKNLPNIHLPNLRIPYRLHFLEYLDLLMFGLVCDSNFDNTISFGSIQANNEVGISTHDKVRVE